MKTYGDDYRKRACAAALAALFASGASGAVDGPDATDYALQGLPGAATAGSVARPVSRFEWMFDAPARWPGPLRWRYNPANAPAPYNTNKDAAIQQLIAAADKWNAACGIQIVYDGETSSAPRTFISGDPDQINVVGWQTPDIGISGATYAWWRSYTPGMRTLVDADMLLDPAYVTSAQQMALTATHEWGHAIGLGHSHIGQTLMSGPPDSQYSNYTDLTGDDVQGCRCLYGPPPGHHAGYLCSLPKEIAFGTLEVGTFGPSRQVDVTNSGDAPLVITGLRIGGGEFLISSNACFPGGAVQPGASCAFSVQARLANTGSRKDELIVDTTEGSYRIPLTASGIAASPAPIANYEGVWSTSPVGSESGWGINLAHQGNVIFATWFTYDATGRAWWLTMTAARTSGNVYEGTLYSTQGSPLNTPFNPGAVTYAEVGHGRLSFDDTGSAAFAYTVNGITQSKTISRLQFAPLPQCTYASPISPAMATNYQDVWWTPGEAGWGVNFTHQGDTIFATWFTYDLDGAPLWLSATMPKVSTGVYSGTLYRTTGPAFSAVPFNPQGVVYAAVGTLTVAFSDGNNATFAYTAQIGPSRITVTGNKPITRLVFQAPGTLCQ